MPQRIHDMNEVLIINLTRMGDLVQTTPVINGLKNAYPEVRITVLANSIFAEICKYIPSIDRLFVFDPAAFVAKGDKNPTLVENFRYIETLLNEVGDVEYDVVINFTHTRASGVLMSLIRAKEVRGIIMGTEGHRVLRHPWLKYFWSMILARECNPFHLCDMYAKVGGALPKEKGLRLQLPVEADNWARAVLKEKGVSDDDLVIGIQLGASKENRRWPVSSFARLADMLADLLGAKVVLFGSAGESGLGREFEELAKTRPVNFMGGTGLKDLAALVKRCNLLISNDTGTLHIATAVGTRVIGVFLATANLIETGPYGERHYAIQADIPCSPCAPNTECKDLVCKDIIKVEQLYALVKEALREEPLDEIEDAPLWREVQVYRSHFSEDSLLAYKPLIKRPPKVNNLYSLLYRQAWFKVLDGSGDYNFEEEYEYVVKKINMWYGLEAAKEALESFEEDLPAFRRLRELAEEGLQRVALIREEALKPSMDVARVKEIWKAVPSIDNEIESLGHTHPPLSLMTIFFRYGKEGLEGGDLGSLADATYVLYNEIKSVASMMVEFIDRLVS